MKKNNKKRNTQSNFAKLSIFQPQKYKFKKKCPLSGKGAPKVDYKNINNYYSQQQLQLLRSHHCHLRRKKFF